MSPGAVWWGNFLFRDTWKVPAGRIAAAAPLRWSAEPTPYTSSEGGGLWGFSRHIKGTQLANTLTFARFVAADPRWQVDLSVGLPGYGPMQQPWLAKQKEANYLVDFDRSAAAFVLAATIVRPDRDYTLYNTGTVWTQTITPALTSGRSFEDAWGAFGAAAHPRGQGVRLLRPVEPREHDEELRTVTMTQPRQRTESALTGPPTRVARHGRPGQPGRHWNAAAPASWSRRTCSCCSSAGSSRPRTRW